MHPYLLNLIYVILVVLLSPWLLFKSITTRKYRQGWPEKLFGLTMQRADDRQCIWLHAVSVGEVNLLDPLIARLLRLFPDTVLVISSTTRTGYELASSKYPDLHVCYCPLDFSWAVNRAIKRIKPDLLVLAELEIWPNLLHACQRHSVKTAVINGRLSEKSFKGYRKIDWLLRPFFASLDFIGSQNDQYAERFIALGAEESRVQVTGSIKFDGAITDRNHSQTTALAKLAGITSLDTVFLAGSTQDPEERYAIEVYQELHVRYPHLKMLIVPRHPERFKEVAKLLNASQLSWRRRSTLERQPAQGAGDEDIPRIILVDTIGELSAWWGAAQIAFVGGSFGSRGGQNMIEPAAFGSAVCFGPNTKNFRDVVELLLEAKAARVVHNQLQLCQFVEAYLKNQESGRPFTNVLGQRARQVVMRQQGAADLTATKLTNLLTTRRSDSQQEKVA